MCSGRLVRPGFGWPVAVNGVSIGVHHFQFVG